MMLVVSKLAQLPHQTVTHADVIISREGKVLKHRDPRGPIDPRKVKRALRLLGIRPGKHHE